MELIGIVKTILRWFWVIIIIVGATTGFLFLQNRSSDPVYPSTVTLEISEPDRDEIAVFAEYSYRSERDEVVIALNKLIEIAHYDEVRQRTLDELGIDTEYELAVDTELGADFVYITALVNDPELAQQLADTHAQKTIEYFGELRTQPLNDAIVYFKNEMELAEQEIDEAELALIAFQQEHGFVSIQSELEIQNNVLDQLETLQSQRNFNATLVDASNSGIDINSILDTPQETTDNPVTFNELIANQRQRIIDVAFLEPEYNTLQQQITSARDKYNTFAGKYTESELKASFASRAFFIQIIQDAYLPTAPVSNRSIIFGIVGSLGVSILLVFFLDYLKSNWRTTS